MNSKQWAVFFVALVSFDYATATYFGKYPNKHIGGKDGYYGWSNRCRCNEDLTASLDDALENVRGSFGRYRKGCPLQKTNLEEYEFTNGRLKGFHKFERKGPYRCSLSNDYVRIIFRIRFYDIMIHYSVSLVEDILGGLFRGVASFIGRILGNISNFFCRIVIPDLYCTVVLIQNFEGRGGFRLEGFYLNEIEDISFQDRRFSKHRSSFVSYFRPVCDHVLRSAFNERLSGEFTRHVTKISAEKEMFYSESSSRSSYEESSESGGSYWVEDDDSDD